MSPLDAFALFLAVAVKETEAKDLKWLKYQKNMPIKSS
jgi:hypothetical protein